MESLEPILAEHPFLTGLEPRYLKLLAEIEGAKIFVIETE